MNITRFSIYGLHGYQDIEINIRDNRIVIVGVNGIGKSTVVNIFYHLIARRWRQLAEFDFDTLSVVIDDELLSVAKQEIVEFLARGSLPRLIRNRIAHRSINISEAEVFNQLINPNLRSRDIEELAQLLSVSRLELTRLRNRYRTLGTEDRSLFEESSNFLRVSAFLDKAVDARILFLPTYRRIEKDLKAIIPDIEQRVRSYEERHARAAVGPGDAEATPYVDLVEFGMQDVKGLIDRTLTELNRFSRDRLNELTGAYLGEVIRGDVDSFDVASVANFSESEIVAILNRVEEHTLSQNDKDILLVH